MDKQILKFLGENIEDLDVLLSIYITHFDCEYCSFFIRQKDEPYYNCVKHSSHTEISFSPESCEGGTSRIRNLILSTERSGYKSEYQVHNIAILPIMINREESGVVCLVNKKNGMFTEDDFQSINTLIGITQLVFHRLQLRDNLKELYSDTKFLSRDLFLANMSHEIRTPLNGIVGYNQLLIQTPLNNVQKVYLTSMNQCSIQLMEIINDVLDFSKLVSGDMRLKINSTSINSVIQTVNETINNHIVEKKQTCKWILSKKLPRYVVIDKQKLIQVLINLLSNANKFTPIGKSIKVRVNDIEQNTLKFSVEDTGIGISHEDQYRIFNAFVKLNDGKSGSGLGLVISKKLVELMGGSIHVKSTLGQGSTFTFTIKYTSHQTIDKSIVENSKYLKNKYVLVVDDTTENRMFLNNTLFDWGMKPVICATPLEALKYLGTDRYDFSIGLIDISMSDMSVTELAKLIREEKPSLSLIAISSESSMYTNLFEDVLDKPIDKLKLFDAIYKVITSKNGVQRALLQSDSKSVSHIPINKEIVNILIAEDIGYNRILLAKMLKVMNYTQISVAKDGKSAIELYDHSIKIDKPFDILLLDLKMPHISGFDVIDYLNSRKTPIPHIVVITASIMDEHKNRCANLGIKYFINKPIDMKQLQQVMAHIVEDS